MASVSTVEDRGNFYLHFQVLLQDPKADTGFPDTIIPTNAGPTSNTILTTTTTANTRHKHGFCCTFNKYNTLFPPALSLFQSSQLMFKGRIDCNEVD
jgi:hypothetical protein